MTDPAAPAQPPAPAETVAAAERDVALLSRIGREALRARGLRAAPPAAVADAVAALDGPAAATPGVRDMRDVAWCSIDNDDSRDIDQLTAAEALDGDRIRLFVAVADVDALVPKGSIVDRHAAHNTTSVYIPGRVFPMLPERLSTDLTSLNEAVDRLAVVVQLDVDAAGMAHDAKLYRAEVHNRAQLAYGAVSAWLDGQTATLGPLARAPELAKPLRLQDRAARRLRQQRHRRGALDLETIEAKAKLVEGEVVDLYVDVKNRARHLIEDAMIAANVATVRFLKQRGYPSLRRVVRRPERWPRIVSVARELGHSLPPEPDAAALQRFLEQQRAADPLRFPDLSLTVVKLLGSGEYVPEFPGGSAPGHFGLALSHYTHATAPNRRYPDLITQRLVKAALAETAVPYTRDELTELADHCTWQEDEAARVERQLRKVAAALLLQACIGDTFNALVTGVTGADAWIRVLRPPVEGKLIGGGGADVGDRLRVRLVSTDLERGHIDFERA